MGRRALRWLRNAGLLVAALALVGLAALAIGALTPRPLSGGHEAADRGASRSFLLLANPIHTDIAFPADPDVVDRFAFLEAGGLPVRDPGVRWIIAGWGGRAFYLETPTWADLKPLPLFKALTVDSSVMHMALAGDIDLDDPAVTLVTVDETRFQSMLEAVLSSFDAAEGATAMPIDGAGYGEYDRFYPAIGRFNAIVGCNTWTASVLRAGGLRTGLWTPLPQTLVWSLRRYNERMAFD